MNSRVRKIQNRLRASLDIVMQESFGGNARRSSRGRLQAGLNALVNRETGEIVSIGNKMRDGLLDDPSISGVIFTYEAGEDSFETGDFIDVQESGLGTPLSPEALQILKASVGK